MTQEMGLGAANRGSRHQPNEQQVANLGIHGDVPLL